MATKARDMTSKKWNGVGEKKVRVMKSVLIHKFEQNRDLRDKLVNTGSRPLLECTIDTFWGTGWVIDSPKSDEPYDYPGQNNLGKILEGICPIIKEKEKFSKSQVTF